MCEFSQQTSKISDRFRAAHFIAFARAFKSPPSVTFEPLQPIADAIKRKATLLAAA